MDKGIIVTINKEGAVEHQLLGPLNDAEILGLGTYIHGLDLSSKLARVYEVQIAIAQTSKVIADQVKKMLDPEEENEEESKESEECGKDLSSDSSPPSDSGPSTENSQSG